MKRIQIVLSAVVADDVTVEDLHFVAGTAMVQIAEPVDEEGEDLDWGVEDARYVLQVDGRLV